MKAIVGLFAGVYLLIGIVGVGNAQTTAYTTSAGGIVPLTPNDAPFITHSGISVYNTDTTNTRVVTGSGILIVNPSGKNFVISGRNNGQSQSCFVNATNMGTGALASLGGGSTTANGFFTYSISTPALAAGTWMYNIYCFLPRANGSSSELYGWY
jgi:hypothetical protein